jgi:hypothetical protein
MLGLLAFHDEGGPLMEAYAGRQFVGMDLHLRRSVLVRMTAEGEVLERSGSSTTSRVWRR